MDYPAVRATVDDVIEAMWRTDRNENLFVREGWPGASCENVSIAVAATLEKRGLGQWTFVQASRPGEMNGHAWLEWPAPDGTVEFSIDATLQQFPEYAHAFIAAGATPAAQDFTNINYRGAIWQWRFLGREDQIFRRLIRAVQRELA